MAAVVHGLTGAGGSTSKLSQWLLTRDFSFSLHGTLHSTAKNIEADFTRTRDPKGEGKTENIKKTCPR